MAAKLDVSVLITFSQKENRRLCQRLDDVAKTSDKKMPNATGAAQRVMYVSNIVLGKELSLMCSCFLPRSVYSETCSNQPQRAGTAQNHKLAAFTIVWTHRGHKRVIREYRHF